MFVRIILIISATIGYHLYQLHLNLNKIHIKSRQRAKVCQPAYFSSINHKSCYNFYEVTWIKVFIFLFHTTNYMYVHRRNKWYVHINSWIENKKSVILDFWKVELITKRIKKVVEKVCKKKQRWSMDFSRIELETS